MQLGYTILYVDDVARSLSFYAQAFGLAQRFAHPSGDYGELETGATVLAFSSRALLASLGKNPKPPSADAPSFEIALVTDDVAAAVERAQRAGARLLQEPAAMPWGQTIAYVADPDGFVVELCTPMGA